MTPREVRLVRNLSHIGSTLSVSELYHVVRQVRDELTKRCLPSAAVADSLVMALLVDAEGVQLPGLEKPS